MKIAILGGGIAGVSLAYALAQEPGASVTVFDPNGIGGGASGVSTGLLHPFPGKRAMRSRHASEGMQATLALLDVAESVLGEKVALRSGVFRPAITEEQKKDFFLRAQEDASTLWCTKESFGEGLWVPEGVTVFSQRFLEGIWLAAEKKGAKFVREKVGSLEALQGFDQIVLATGASILQFPGCEDLPATVTKGQTLLCKMKEPLPFSLISQGHISLTKDPHLCHIGSTYEHSWHSNAPDPTIALGLIPKAALFYPKASSFEVVDIRTGFRLSQKGSYLPIVKKIGPKTWIFTALGSRGLLYAPWMGKRLAMAIYLETVVV